MSREARKIPIISARMMHASFQPVGYSGFASTLLSSAWLSPDVPFWLLLLSRFSGSRFSSSAGAVGAVAEPGSRRSG